ncbi:MAG: DUF2147 domain-containing protein [Thiovulaceae bacterium]|nr:DUF2147 domain-containing protein [Sulfurimonadaceae bacterium]
MNKKLFLLLAAMALSAISFGQIGKITGNWYTIDEDGNRKSLVKIYRTPAGVYEGVILKIFTGPQDKKCEKCTGENQNKPIVGLKFVYEMKSDGNKITGGRILDPANGKIYSCTMSFDSSKNKLKVRGSLDKSGILGRTQYWNPTTDVN